jgi:hypothetical protein
VATRRLGGGDVTRVVAHDQRPGRICAGPIECSEEHPRSGFAAGAACIGVVRAEKNVVERQAGVAAFRYEARVYRSQLLGRHKAPANIRLIGHHQHPPTLTAERGERLDGPG